VFIYLQLATQGRQHTESTCSEDNKEKEPVVNGENQS